MKRGKIFIEFLFASFLYSLLVIFIDFVIIFFLQEGLIQILDTLSLVLLLEGGIGLTVGGATASYTPLGAKISEVLFRSETWTVNRQKEVEKHARAWIVTGIFLVCEALLLSAM